MSDLGYTYKRQREEGRPKGPETSGALVRPSPPTDGTNYTPPLWTVA
jgi:hypothetical protein